VGRRGGTGQMSGGREAQARAERERDSAKPQEMRAASSKAVYRTQPGRAKRKPDRAQPKKNGPTLIKRRSFNETHRVGRRGSGCVRRLMLASK
jgi:hypothetical protein